MFAEHSGLLQGTLELLGVQTLSSGPMHGYGIAAWIEGASGDVQRVAQGSPHPALYRMTKKGWQRLAEAGTQAVVTSPPPRRAVANV